MRRAHGKAQGCQYFSGTPVCEFHHGGEKSKGLRGIIVDMTERKFMEEELLKGQKLESIGILAGGIAHDFNNMLTAILGNISLAHHLTKSEPKLSKLLDDSEKASLQARNLTKQLISLAKGGAPSRRPFRSASPSAMQRNWL